jgi:hypothetical protein
MNWPCSVPVSMYYISEMSQINVCCSVPVISQIDVTVTIENLSETGTVCTPVM